MKGLLKRDLYLISGNLRFYICFIAVIGILTAFTDMNSSFLGLYVVIFAMSTVTGLFSYDEFNHWTAYAAVVPGGRKKMVDARYLLLLLTVAVVLAIQVLVGLLGREKGVLTMAALYGGMLLIYAAVTMPINYHFGGTRARMAMIVVVAVLAAVMAMCGTFLGISHGIGRVFLPTEILALPAIGAVALLVSYRVSLGIMSKKEL